ncbi:MAG: prolipoprotein diacylglyceryl transferase [Bacilli bacterium]|nr:prolipoprotein diacylglyceryl transferase [Bacilli bacterium]
MALFWVAFAFMIVALGATFYLLVRFVKHRDLLDFDFKTKYGLLASGIAFTLMCLLMGFGIKLGRNYAMIPSHLAMMIFGSLIFGLAFFTLVTTFVLYYYKTTLVANKRKWIRRIMFIAIPFLIIFLVMDLDAFSYYASFPLISGIAFTSEGVKFVTGSETEGFTIKWYGIIILGGAFVAYFIADHKLYQEYKRHGLIDTMFIVAFLFGIFGARFWYCIVLNPGTPFFDFQSGGMGIMGGVIFGATAGIIFMLVFRRYINIRHAIDLIVPGILIAQAIGRWGNFFNHEVYGSLELAINEVWWLPNFIKQQMAVSFTDPTMMYLPLFIIEGVINVGGYFLIVYAVGKLCNKHLSYGDLGALYVSWYGLVRVILEPMRNGGDYFLTSWIVAWVMFGGGLLVIVGLHLYDYLRWGKRTFNLSLNNFTNPKNPYYVKK